MLTPVINFIRMQIRVKILIGMWSGLWASMIQRAVCTGYYFNY